MPLNVRTCRMNFLHPGLLALACLLALPGAANDLPSLGDASSAIVSPTQEHQLGRAWLSLLRGQVPHLSDAQLKDYVETSVYRLSETSQVQDRRLEFVLLDSPQLNAFAAPRRHHRRERRPFSLRRDRSRIRRGAGPRTGAPLAAPFRAWARSPATPPASHDGHHACRHHRCRCRCRRRRHGGNCLQPGGGNAGNAALFPPERTGSRPHRPAQSGKGWL